MGNDTDFRIISVDSDEPSDEVVIQAGAVHSQSAYRGSLSDANSATDSYEPREAALPDEGASADAEDFGEADAEAAVGSEAYPPSLSEAERLIAEGAVDEEAMAEYAAFKRRARAREEANAMLTTEDDLHAKMPFSRMQRVIVVALILLVVAFVLYYFVGVGAA